MSIQMSDPDPDPTPEKKEKKSESKYVAPLNSTEAVSEEIPISLVCFATDVLNDKNLSLEGSSLFTTITAFVIYFRDRDER